jgi:hypothetical protein
MGCESERALNGLATYEQDGIQGTSIGIQCLGTASASRQYSLRASAGWREETSLDGTSAGEESEEANCKSEAMVQPNVR